MRHLTQFRHASGELARYLLCVTAIRGGATCEHSLRGAMALSGALRFLPDRAKIVLADAHDAQAVDAALRQVRPAAVIDELTSLPRNGSPKAMRAASRDPREAEGRDNVFSDARAAGVRRYGMRFTDVPTLPARAWRLKPTRSRRTPLQRAHGSADRRPAASHLGPPRGRASLGFILRAGHMAHGGRRHCQPGP